MTEERIEEIKKETIFRAGKAIKKLEFESKEQTLFELGEIFGQLNRDLTRELRKELDRPRLVRRPRPRGNNHRNISTYKRENKIQIKELQNAEEINEVAENE